MLDFTINHIIGEAYNKVLTGRGVLEASQETNYTPTTNNVQDKVYEDAVRNALNSLGLKDYPKRTALLTKIMGRIASRPKNRSYQDQINYIYNYYKNIGKNDLANKIVKVANHIFSNNNTQAQIQNSGNNANSTQAQAPVQSDNTPYYIDFTPGSLSFRNDADAVARKFGVEIDDRGYVKDMLKYLFDNVAKVGYPAAREDFIKKYKNKKIIEIADYINQNKAVFIEDNKKQKEKAATFSKAYQQSTQKHNNAINQYKASNNTPQTNNKPSQPPTNNRPNRPKNSTNILPSIVVGDDDLI